MMYPSDQSPVPPTGSPGEAMYSITLPFPPSVNRYWRAYRGRVCKSADAKAYQEKAGWEAKAAGIQPITGKVAVTLHFYRPIRRGDLDNRVKVLLDALQGIAYADDNQVNEIHAHQGDDCKNPRVEVCITGIDDPPKAR